MFAFALAVALLPQAPVVSKEATEIPFRTVSFGSNGKIKEGGAIVIRDTKAFDAYRTLMGTKDTRKPTIDWTKEELVAIHASGTGYGGASLQVSKVRQKPDGGLEVEAFLNRQGQPAIPNPGSLQVLRKIGIYSIVAVSRTTGDVTLKVVDPPQDRGDKTGTFSRR